MLGYSHALSGVVAGAAVGMLFMHEPAAPLVLFAGLTSAYALANDLDCHGGTEARSFGFITEALAWFVAKVSGGHRHGTHSAVGVAAFTLVAWLACLFRHTWPGRIALGVILAVGLASAMDALHLHRHGGNLLACAGAALMCWTGYGLVFVPIAAALGTTVHILGDGLTVSGVPICWPFSARDFHLTPRPLRFVTGHWPEHFVVVPLLFAALLFLGWRDAGTHPAILHMYLAGRITP